MRHAARRLYRYLRFQGAVAAAGIRERKREGARPGIPIPPARLRHRVHGGFGIAPFLHVGRQMAADVSALLEAAGRPLISFRSVLDFGCGCGRLLRHLTGAPATCRITGTDIDESLIGWCRKNIPGVHFTVNAALPPTGFEDGAFDLIVGISVFTHLDERYQNLWLAELARISAPGGIVLLSVHGSTVAQRLPSPLQQRLGEAGFLFISGTTGALKIDGLPDFYQDAYHTRDYVERAWSRFFEILKYAPRGINDHQDAVLLRKA